MKPLHLSILFIAASFVFVQNFLVAQDHHEAKATVANPDSVITWLQKGNAEFIKGNVNTHAIDPKLREELAKGQHPKAVILTCADSRVSPELVFNKSLGDLFVIRVAGNITDDAINGSIEYAAEHLHASLVVIMGHTSCGAVAAAVNDMKESEEHSGINNHVRALTDKIQEAVLFANEKDADPIKNALISNIKYNVTLLRNSHPTLKNMVTKHELKVVGAVYHIDNGNVEWLNY
jgi:carbonic anhydrase